METNLHSSEAMTPAAAGMDFHSVSPAVADALDALCVQLGAVAKGTAAETKTIVRALGVVHQTITAGAAGPSLQSTNWEEARIAVLGTQLVFREKPPGRRLLLQADEGGAFFGGSLVSTALDGRMEAWGFDMRGSGGNTSLVLTNGAAVTSCDLEGPPPDFWTHEPQASVSAAQHFDDLDQVGMSPLQMSHVQEGGAAEGWMKKALDYFDLGKADVPAGGVRWKEVGEEILEEATDSLAEQAAHHAKQHLAPPPLPKKSVQWHYALKDETKGPVSEAELLKLLADGKVKLSTLVWNKAMSEWAALADTPLSAHVTGDAPPPPLPAGRKSLKERILAAAAKCRSCPSCGHELDASDRFCPSCGARLNS